MTLTSCEVGYTHTAWYGGSTIQKYGVKMFRVYNYTIIRSYYSALVGHGFFIIDRAHFISWIYTAAWRHGTAL